MRALVTGGAGFVGTNLIKRLLSDGWEVVSLDNYSTGFKTNHLDGCKYYEIDLSDKISIESLDAIRVVNQIPKFDVIFHLAALARIQPSFDKPSETFRTNAVGTQNILEYSRKNGNIPLVYAGSSSSHGDIYANPYTFTKYQGEQLTKMYNKIYDTPTAICRFYNVYGPHQLTEGEYCTVVGIFERQYKNGRPLTITWDGEQRRDFTHVDDIVDGFIKCGKSLWIPNEYNAKVSGEEFELGTGNNYSINEVADAFGDYPREYIERRPGEMRNTLCTDTKAHELLGWKPKKDLVEFIKKYYVE